MMPYNPSSSAKKMRTIYFVRPIGGGPVKVGCSKTPLARFQFFAEWSPVPMELVAKCPGRMVDERQIHRALKDFRMHGEWFAPNAQLDALIEHVAAFGALPAEYVCEMAPEPAPRPPTKNRKPSKGYERRMPREELSRRMSEARKRWHAAQRGVRGERALVFKIVQGAG